MQFLVEVNYKSGISRQFWCSKFEIETKLNGSKTFKWTADPTENRHPLLLNADEIESVWVLESKLDT